jgi:uncharacterized protein
MIVAGFDWDDGNWPKCGKHGVSKDEIETLFRDGPDVHANPHHSVMEQRSLAIGKTPAGRWLLVAFTIRERAGLAVIRPVSARYMHKKEIEHYEQQKEAKET